MAVSNILNTLYVEDNNYKIVNISDRKICYIFCSSNGLWPNLEDLQHNDVLKDRYEWFNVSKNNRLLKKAGKYIFIRDVFEKCYVDGINHNINCIDKIINFLKKETSGYDTIAVGSSGGGYLAMILGGLLQNCIGVYSFGGLFSLYTWTGASNDFTFESVKEYQEHIDDYNYSKYYSIRDLISKYNKPLLHFYGANHYSDCVQLKEIQGIPNANIKLIGIKANKHGGDFYGLSYPYILTLSERKVRKIIKKCKLPVSKNYFAVMSMGLFPFIWCLCKRMFFKRGK